MADSLKHSVYSQHVSINDHIVKWDSVHELICKSAIDEATETLENSFLKITIMEEIHGGKSSRIMGSLAINLSPFCNRGNRECRRRFIMSSGLLKKANCVLEISIKMCQKFGDPCFRVPNEEDNFCVNAQETLRRENCVANGENTCQHNSNSNNVNLMSEGRAANFGFLITGDDDEVIGEDEFEEEQENAQGTPGACSIIPNVHTNNAAGCSSSCHSASPCYSGVDLPTHDTNSDTALSMTLTIGGPVAMTSTATNNSELPIPSVSDLGNNELCVCDGKLKTSPSLPNPSRLLILLQQEQSLDLPDNKSQSYHLCHRRNVSAFDSSFVTDSNKTEDTFCHRGSGPSFVDDMSAVYDDEVALMNQKRISRSSTNCYEEVKNHQIHHLTPNHQNHLFLHPSMAFEQGYPNNKQFSNHYQLTPNHQPQNRLSRQELVNITRGSRADIVDDVLQKVLQTKLNRSNPS